MLVPIEILPRLKCYKCKHILSLLPVYILDNGNNICVICRSVYDELNPKPNNVYNEIAFLLLFPCAFFEEGCNEKLYSTNVFNHESNCLYRDRACPNSKSCVWLGNYKHLMPHYEESHQSLIIHNDKEKVALDINQKYFKNSYLLKRFEKLFLVEVETNNGDLFFVVSLLKFQPEVIDYNYVIKLDFSNVVQNLSVSTEKRKVELHNSSLQTLHNATSYRINLKETFKNLSTLHFQVFITGPGKKPPANPQKSLNPMLLKKIECPICFEVLTPPIFICVNGHTICYECKRKIVSCPACKEGNFIRNRILEDVVQDIDIPCKYCSVTVPVPNMEQHVRICAEAPQTCPFITCEEKCNLYEHMKSSHKARFREYKEQFVSMRTPVDGKVDRVWKFGDVLVKANINIRTMCVFDIALLQSSGEQNVYFTLEFKGGDNESFRVKRKCHSFSTNDVKRVLLLPLDSLSPFINILENFIEYTITIE